MDFDASRRLIVQSVVKPADLAVTATGAASAAVTVTLPAPERGLYQHITMLAVSGVGGQATIDSAIITSTNLPGNWALTVGVITNGFANTILPRTHPLRARVPATTVTITAPAVTNTIWRLTVEYYNAQAV